MEAQLIENEEQPWQAGILVINAKRRNLMDRSGEKKYLKRSTLPLPWLQMQRQTHGVHGISWEVASYARVRRLPRPTQEKEDQETRRLASPVRYWPNSEEDDSFDEHLFSPVQPTSTRSRRNETTIRSPEEERVWTPQYDSPSSPNNDTFPPQPGQNSVRVGLCELFPPLDDNEVREIKGPITEYSPSPCPVTVPARRRINF